jgi:DNA-directed RNA polymerase specialized sigma24 family protein
VLAGGASEAAEATFSDPELFECIARGEERAASALYRKLLPEVEQALLAVLERRDARHDELVQRSFERMIARISRRRYAEACGLSSWARAVSAHVALIALRAEQRRRGSCRAPHLSAVQASAPQSSAPQSSAPERMATAAGAAGERSSFTSRGVACLRASVSRLSAAQAELVVLHDLLCLPIAEIATLRRLSLAATQARLVRAHKELTVALLGEGWLAQGWPAQGASPQGRRSEPPRPSQPARGRVQPLAAKAPDLEDLFGAWRNEARAHHRGSSIGRGGSRPVARALQLVARRRRRTRRLNTLGLAAVALLTLLGVGFGIWFAQQRLSGEAERVAAAEPRVLLGGVLGDVTVSDREGRASHGFASLGEGYTLRTDDGSARLGFASGAAVNVSHHSRLVLLSAQDTEVFYLGNGSAEIDLPDLALGGSFAVETPDTHVTSRAAQFVVGVESDGGPPATRITVRTGSVLLRSAGKQLELGAGESWPGVSPASVAPAVSPSAPAASGVTNGGALEPQLMLPEIAPRSAAPVDSAEK